ncbi:MAG: type VI secretion system-associated FHA domain protein TagH [Nitrospinota bacterium]
MPAKLVVKTKNGDSDMEGSEHLFDQHVITIGRDPSNLLCLPDPKRIVSSKHARIEFSEGAFHLIDIGSKNGTYLNEERLMHSQGLLLHDNDKIGIGDFILSFAEVTPESEEQTIIGLDKTMLTTKEEAEVKEGVPPDIEGSEKEQHPGPEGPDLSKKDIVTEEYTALTDEEIAKEADNIARGLCRVYSEQGEIDTEARDELLTRTLKEKISSLDTEDSKKVITAVKGYFPERSYERDRLVQDNQELTASLSKWEKEQKLYQSAYHALSILSDRFVKGRSSFESKEEIERFCTRIEKTLDVLLRCLIDALKGRKQFEYEFDVQVTQILSWEHNPVKSAATSEELAAHLLNWENSERDIEKPSQDLEKAFRDLMTHQLGLLSGTRQSLHALLQEFAPELIEKEIKESGDYKWYVKLLYKIPPLLQWGIWRRYMKKHRAFSENKKKSFEKILGPNFPKGYLELLKKIDQSKRGVS